MSEYQSTNEEEIEGQSADDDLMVTEDGYTSVTPEFDELDMLYALQDPDITDSQSALSPQEAYEAMKFEAPLDDEEEHVLATTPFLQADPRGHGAPLQWVDDPDHSEYLLNRMAARHKGMDQVLEDQMYGDGMFGLTEEEMMDRAGSEVGFGLSTFKKIGRRVGSAAKRVGKTTASLAKKSVTVPTRATLRVAKKATSAVVKKFVPGRDGQKAALVKNLNVKLVQEHANWLAIQDRKRGIKKPVSAYLDASKLWAKNTIQKGGLPTSYSSGSAVAGNILGDDSCGDWWNPLSWFNGIVNNILHGTQGQRASDPPPDDATTPTDTPPTDAAPTDAPPPDAYAPPPDEAPPPDAYAPPPDDSPPADYAPPPDGSEGEDDWTSSLTSAFRAGQKGGEGLFTKSEGDDFMALAHHHRKHRYHVAGLIEDVSQGALEERMIEASGDADVGRFMRRGGGYGGGHHGGGHHGHHGHHGKKGKNSSPEAQAARAAIKSQLASKVVSDALVRKLAASYAGAASGAAYDKCYAHLKASIERRGATVSADKSETGAFVGAFVGWA